MSNQLFKTANKFIFKQIAEAKTVEELLPLEVKTNKATAGSILGQFFSTYSHLSSKSEKDFIAMLSIYVNVCCDSPEWALRQALENFLKADVEGCNPYFCPPVSAIMAEIDRLTVRLKVKKQELINQRKFDHDKYIFVPFTFDKTRGNIYLKTEFCAAIEN